MNPSEMSELDKKRHSLAHLLAAAVLEHYPDAQPTIGPPTDTGFYYDFGNLDLADGDADLKKIQKSMKKLLNKWHAFDGKEVSQDEAEAMYADNPYKLELIKEIAERGEAITLYTSGDFTDLCRGGHVDDMSTIDGDTFELDKVAGAYWRGNENNAMLTRIYGLAFDSKEDLVAYKTQLEEAKKRDHRKIGQELDLFTFSELVGPGLPLFTPKGTALRNAIVDKIYDLQDEYNYQQVWIPHITKPELYKTSGHWDKFGDQLFKVRGRESEFVMKPMNCPHHTQIYASQARSYKDLPLRYTEATTVYRDEQSGELMGLGRVRSITQDDGHVFCTREQVEEEIRVITNIIEDFYSALGVFAEGNYWVSLSTRDPEEPDKYLGDASAWDESEAILEKIAKDRNYPYKVVPGEAAFYGPKIDFMFKDAIGRERQLATIQLDFNMPSRFGLEYTDSDGVKKTPVMIHRAIAGSLERFLSIFIEHFAGAFPFWMSPTQIAVIPVGDTHNEYAAEVYEQLKGMGYRVELDTSSDGFGKKVRAAKTNKTPYFLVLGDQEVADKTVTVESRDEGNIGAMSLDDFVEKLQ